MSDSEKLHLVEVAFHAFKLMLCALDVPFSEKFTGGCNVLESTSFEIVCVFTGFTFLFFHHRHFTVT